MNASSALPQTRASPRQRRLHTNAGSTEIRALDIMGLLHLQRLALLCLPWHATPLRTVALQYIELVGDYHSWGNHPRSLCNFGRRCRRSYPSLLHQGWPTPLAACAPRGWPSSALPGHSARLTCLSLQRPRHEPLNPSPPTHTSVRTLTLRWRRPLP